MARQGTKSSQAGPLRKPASWHRKGSKASAQGKGQGTFWTSLAFASLGVLRKVSKASAQGKGQGTFWTSLAIVSLGVLLMTLYLLFEIYAPKLLLPMLVFVGLLGGDKLVALGIGGVAVAVALAITTVKKLWGHVHKLFSWRSALVLAGVTFVAFLWTLRDRQENTDCPILRIKPAGYFGYFLQDKSADKPSESTFEIVVSWKKEHRSFYPSDEGTLYIGAWKPVLVWRATRKQEAQKGQDRENEPSNHYLSTDRFETGDVIRISAFCQNPRKELFSIEERIEHNQKPLKDVLFGPADDDVFAKEMLTCEPKS